MKRIFPCLASLLSSTSTSQPPQPFQMASSTSRLRIPFPLLLVLLFLPKPIPATTCYTSVFSFGDSITDTGNFLQYNKTGPEGRLPYGETYFHHPTGRFSDGRLIVDFFAQEVGVPLLPPYLAGPGDHGFRQGANFAVGGATALDNDYFGANGLDAKWTVFSLRTQIDWFKQLLPSLCSSDSECEDILSSSLFIVGEIGGNDYNYALLEGRAVDEIRTFVPDVISAITSAIKVLIELGAKTLVVPGNFAIGCVPLFLAIFKSSAAGEYDPQTGCIKWLNELSQYHDRLLLDELDQLRRLYPHTTIIYANYYKALYDIFLSPHDLGFEKPFDACLRCGDLYNCSIESGEQVITLCSDPSKHISWDGLHLTEAAYRTIALGLLSGLYTTPSMILSCPHIDQYATSLRNASGQPTVQTYSVLL